VCGKAKFDIGFRSCEHQGTLHYSVIFATSQDVVEVYGCNLMLSSFSLGNLNAAAVFASISQATANILAQIHRPVGSILSTS
jgi:hypothetical protein